MLKVFVLFLLVFARVSGQERMSLHHIWKDNNSIVLFATIRNNPRVEECRFVRSDGLSFNSENVPTQYVIHLNGPYGSCALTILDPTSEYDVNSWTVVAKVFGKNEENSTAATSDTIFDSYEDKEGAMEKKKPGTGGGGGRPPTGGGGSGVRPTRTRHVPKEANDQAGHRSELRRPQTEPTSEDNTNSRIVISKVFGEDEEDDIAPYSTTPNIIESTTISDEDGETTTVWRPPRRPRRRTFGLPMPVAILLMAFFSALLILLVLVFLLSKKNRKWMNQRVAIIRTSFRRQPQQQNDVPDLPKTVTDLPGKE